MILTVFLGLATSQGPNIQQYVQRDLQDASFLARKVRGNQRELAKINKDFGNSYRFDKIAFQYKEPLKLRVEATVDSTSALYIIDGPRQTVRVPRLRIRQTFDLKNAPGRRQSPLDFGVLTPGMFTELFQAKYVRRDRTTGEDVFDLTYQNPEDTSRHRVWVDREKGITTKREWYNQPGRQLATFFYEEPTKVGSTWFPTRMTVRNVDDVVAGVTAYEAMKINTGLADSVFEVK
jgi:outer membrane lipoprotein-sorting protein